MKKCTMCNVQCTIALFDCNIQYADTAPIQCAVCYVKHGIDSLLYDQYPKKNPRQFILN